MSDRDDTQWIALALATGTAGLVVAAAVALAVSSTQFDRDAQADTPTASEAFGAVERVEFEPGSAALSADANEALQRTAEVARADGGLSVLVLPLQGPNADAPASALAEARGRAARHALVANGVPPQRVIVAPPEVAGDPDAERMGDTVELRLQ